MSRDRPEVVLVDTNAVIEAVRSGCWAAITGGLRVETVRECDREVGSGSADTIPGYVPVSAGQLARLKAVHPVEDSMRAALQLAVEDLPALDPGERDLLAYAYQHRDEAWVLCSPDKACIRTAVLLGLGDRVWSLERIAGLVGENPDLREHFGESWLRGFRTSVLLDLG